MPKNAMGESEDERMQQALAVVDLRRAQNALGGG